MPVLELPKSIGGDGPEIETRITDLIRSAKAFFLKPAEGRLSEGDVEFRPFDPQEMPFTTGKEAFASAIQGVYHHGRPAGILQTVLLGYGESTGITMPTDPKVDPSERLQAKHRAVVLRERRHIQTEAVMPIATVNERLTWFKKRPKPKYQPFHTRLDLLGEIEANDDIPAHVGKIATINWQNHLSPMPRITATTCSVGLQNEWTLGRESQRFAAKSALFNPYNNLHIFGLLSIDELLAREIDVLGHLNVASPTDRVMSVKQPPKD